MKQIKHALAALLVSVGVANADSINWFNTLAPLLDASGNNVGGESGWVINMYVSTDATIEFVNGAPTDDDVILASVFSVMSSAGHSGVDGFFSNTFDPTVTGGPVDGANVYSVIFNATNIAQATQYAVIDGAVSVVQDSTPPGPPAWNYETGGTVAGDWQPIVIPEPASMALVGLGIVAAGLRRKMRANA